jgi:hypothetical protein
LSLLLCCDTAATETHTDLFRQVLQCLCVQLTFALPGPEQRGGKAEVDAVCAPGEGTSALDGIELADLLNTSFLKQGILSFLEVLITERDSLPQPLWHQVQHPNNHCLLLRFSSFALQTGLL